MSVFSSVYIKKQQQKRVCWFRWGPNILTFRYHKDILLMSLFQKIAANMQELKSAKEGLIQSFDLKMARISVPVEK